MTRVALCLLLRGFTQATAASFLRAGQISKQDAEQTLANELAGGVGEERLHQLEEALGTTFASLPKDAEGRLGHYAVRYVLHRLFVQRHGWYIKGLELSDEAGNASSRAGLAPPHGPEWVAAYFQEKMEETLGGKGAGLKELAILAAALEDHVRQEASDRLRIAYEIHQLNTTGNITEEQMDDVIETFFTAFLVANNFSANSSHEAHRKRAVFRKLYNGYREAEEWLLQLVGPRTGRAVDFKASSDVAVAIGEQYHVRNEQDCKSLKKTLLELEGTRPGRVSLADFYNAGRHSHWRFNERPEYLKLLGALDDSDADKLQVIVPNYVMGRINCLEVSRIYALCCQNECEDLMGQLEREIGAPEADASTLITIAERLSTDTVEAPRQLSDGLHNRLAQVAEIHGGRVPLHGRLFAQWMHHAFPRECPYPHQAGSTSSMTPDEWAEATSLPARASEEEIDQVCSASESVGPADDAATNRVEELPWSQVEEVLVRPEAGAGATRAGHPASAAGRVAAASGSAGLALLLALCSRRAASQPRRSCQGLLDGEETSLAGAALLGSQWLRALLGMTSLALFAFAAGILDVKLLGWSVGGALAFGCYQLALPRLVLSLNPRSKCV